MKTQIPEKKKENIREMFNNISHSYDTLNHLLSLGIDKSWRKKLLKEALIAKPNSILDVATGTGDLAIALSKTNAEKIVGIDISEGMLMYAKEKIKGKENLTNIQFQTGDAENINFPDNSFDIVTAAFGVRNFENLEKGLSEFYRILNPGGQTLILEFSQVENPVLRPLFKFYFNKLLPFVGNSISKSKNAYTYLPKSTETFPSGKDFLAILEKIGFIELKKYKLSGGIATLYQGKKL